MRWGVNLAGAEFGDGKLPGTRNQDYTYDQREDTMRQFVDMGLGLFRLPVRWERVQRGYWWNLDAGEVAAIRGVLDMAHACGAQVILELHNYGRYYGQPMQANQYWYDGLRDVWLKLSRALAAHPAVYGYELMNEPHDLLGGGVAWAHIAQAVVNILRQIGDGHPILVPGYDWQSAHRWRESNEGLNIHDPLNKVIYAAHSYWDADGSGRYEHGYDVQSPNISYERVGPFLEWLEARNFRGAVTEFGVPRDRAWLTVLGHFINYMNHPNIDLATAWAAGPWWGPYPLSLEPPPPPQPPPPMPPQLDILSRAAQGG